MGGYCVGKCNHPQALHGSQIMHLRKLPADNLARNNNRNTRLDTGHILRDKTRGPCYPSRHEDNDREKCDEQ